LALFSFLNPRLVLKMVGEDPLDHTAVVVEQTSAVEATVKENLTADSVAEKLNPSLTGEEIVELLNNLTNTGLQEVRMVVDSLGKEFIVAQKNSNPAFCHYKSQRRINPSAD